MSKKNYSTKQKKYLISFFKSNPEKCFTTEDIFKLASDGGVNIGQTTIYRNLEVLVREGLILRRDMPAGSGAVFQLLTCNANERECYHLYCTLCGEITHLECNHLKQISAHIRKEHKFNCDIKKTVFYGLCQKCADTN